MTTLTREDVIYKHPVTQDMYSHEKWKYANKRCQEFALKIADEIDSCLIPIKAGGYWDNDELDINTTKLYNLIKVLRSAQGEKKKDETHNI